MVIQLLHHVNGKHTSLGRVGPYMTINILDEIAEEKAKMKETDNNNITTTTYAADADGYCHPNSTKV